MFHIAGITPEAPDVASALGGKAPSKHLRVSIADLLGSWWELNSAESTRVELVALGNPHLLVNWPPWRSYARAAASIRKPPWW